MCMCGETNWLGQVIGYDIPADYPPDETKEAKRHSFSIIRYSGVTFAKQVKEIAKTGDNISCCDECGHPVVSHNWLDVNVNGTIINCSRKAE